MSKTWAEVLIRLLEEKVLVADNAGIIQISPEYYQQLGKSIPGTAVSQNKERASKLAPLYIELWPKKIMSGGRPVRQGSTAISKKLLVFMNKHPKVTDTQILEATKRYTIEKMAGQWQYSSCSDYFISKNDASLLESYIENPELGNNNTNINTAYKQRSL